MNALGNARMINFDDVTDYDFFGNDDSDEDEYENDFEVFNDNLEEYQDDENLDEENDSNDEDDYESELEYNIVIE